MVRILLADDSPTARELIRDALRARPGLDLIGEAETGREAVALSERLQPDVVLMDVHMPELDGFAATRSIMSSTHPVPTIIFSSELDAQSPLFLYNALNVGAAGISVKPPVPTSPHFDAAIKELRRAVEKAAGDSPKSGRSGARSTVTGPPVTALVLADDDELHDLLAGLPHPPTRPVLVALSSGNPGPAPGLPGVVTAHRGEIPVPGRVYLPPAGTMLRLRPGTPPRLGFVDTPTSGPAATLLASVAQISGRAAVGIFSDRVREDLSLAALTLRLAGGRLISLAHDSRNAEHSRRVALAEAVADAIVPPEWAPRIACGEPVPGLPGLSSAETARRGDGSAISAVSESRAERSRHDGCVQE